jgi:hypothetical protein
MHVLCYWQANGQLRIPFFYVIFLGIFSIYIRGVGEDLNVCEQT